mgnify:FL=1|tara:strand:- start:4914 stop:6092 length:1179 start_codon:yes stop_codon:yes gene_type:complete
MAGDNVSQTRPHMLSPSAWNRYETCPRMYWLSRQKLPRKAGMAASLGTAVHASIEDLLLTDYSHIGNDQDNWLPGEGERLLKVRWDEEKEVFMNTPRRPMWKEEKWKEAKRHQKGGIIMLLDHIGIQGLDHNRITGALWRKVQKHAIAVEGELKTSNGRLMGRLDLLLADVDSNGNMVGWLVADLKTGRTPNKELKSEVNRQLRLYRDILLDNNENPPPVRTEGWYTLNSSKWPAIGDNVLEQAYSAWEKTQPTTMPMEPTPGPDSCGGFCDWKAWCPHWWNWRFENGSLHRDDFSDAVVLLHDFDSNSGSAVIELCEPLDNGIRAIPTGIKKSARFDGRGKEALQEVLDSAHQGPLFLGSIMTTQNTWRIGHWCDVLPWNPIHDGIEYHKE